MKYMSLDQRGRVQAEYIWIDSTGGTRSKTKVCTYRPHFHLFLVFATAPLSRA